MLQYIVSEIQTHASSKKLKRTEKCLDSLEHANSPATKLCDEILQVATLACLAQMCEQPGASLACGKVQIHTLQYTLITFK